MRGGEARRGQDQSPEDGAGLQLEGGDAGPARGDTDHDQRLHLPFQCAANLQRAQGEDAPQHKGQIALLFSLPFSQPPADFSFLEPPEIGRAHV